MTSNPVLLWIEFSMSNSVCERVLPTYMNDNAHPLRQSARITGIESSCFIPAGCGGFSDCELKPSIEEAVDP